MTKVYFVRHAEPNLENHDDRSRELSEKGLKDRKLVTEFFKNKKIDIALSSPYKRSIDTIRDYTDSVNLRIETIEDFRERKIGNEWIEDFTTFAINQWSDFSYKLTDGESLEEVQERNINALNEVLKKYKGKNIIVGSHGTALSAIINYYNKNFDYSEFKRIKKKMPWIVEFDFDDEMNLNFIKEHDLFK